LNGLELVHILMPIKLHSVILQQSFTRDIVPCEKLTAR
jgi:hypothetical protein